jgi:hypothetical protein
VYLQNRLFRNAIQSDTLIAGCSSCLIADLDGEAARIDSVLFVQAEQLSAQAWPQSTAISNRGDRTNVKTSRLGAPAEFIGGVGAGARFSLPNDYGNGPFVRPTVCRGR